MAIVGHLTGGVVHDFNNLLTVIIGTIEVLEEAVADRPELSAIAGLIAEAAARGADLTSHLLAFARGQPSPPRDVDVNALLIEAARLLRPTLGEQIEVDCRLASGVSSVWVDASQLMTVILNLAVVARDAMPDGGKLMLESKAAVAGEGCAGAGPEFPLKAIPPQTMSRSRSVSRATGTAPIAGNSPSPISAWQPISPRAPMAISGCFAQPAGRRLSKFTCRGRRTSFGRRQRPPARRICRAAIKPS